MLRYRQEQKWFKKNSDLSYLKNINPEKALSDPIVPIFIFSAGWRSGSTLLQRLVLSSEDILMWGEPFDKSNIVESMSESLIHFSDYWPPKTSYLNEEDVNYLSDKWVANLYPRLETLKKSHRSFFDTLFNLSTKEKNMRWGVKEVRWGKKEARYLKWLYPNAKFVFLVRDPYQSYSSFKAIRTSWFARWPIQRVYNPLSFSRHWNMLVNDFVDVYQEVDGVLIKYEDLVGNKLSVLDTINTYLGIEIDPSILKNKIGSTRIQNSLNYVEKLMIKYNVEQNYKKLYV
ncbi:sulfotransferase family protein [Paraglaciecola hydrolytica]|uniref:Sulfotransferase n=1 Tax=Paraglaciecola hydrolytica TaxID=1799789 RepID=A0A135ZZS1_9ALTE|nr:sulfotransferase [Paraglaciecola hydrolytica]KXI28498.1 hypothetical protein AX660_15520 [Paraglaciecola hydrolytica]